LCCFYIWYAVNGAEIRPSLASCAIPLIFAWLAMIAAGFGMSISALTTKYRDLKLIVAFGLNLAMYATPIVYPLSEAPEKYRWVFYVNPVSAPIELFRVWFFQAGFLPNTMLVTSLCTTIFIFILGLFLFNYNERNFVDVI
jgi:lipopolysaccharide transport system permease protein